MSQPRYATALVILAVLAGSGVGAAMGEIHRNVETPAARNQPVVRPYETETVHTFHTSRQIARAPFTLEQLSVIGHGGTTVIEWYTGAWSPLVENATEAVALYLDGSELAETVAGGRGGEFDARAGVLRWVGPLAPGPHVVSVKVVQLNGAVMLPLAVANGPVQEGISVTEYIGA
jgi:hypothetical protein